MPPAISRFSRVSCVSTIVWRSRRIQEGSTSIREPPSRSSHSRAVAVRRRSPAWSRCSNVSTVARTWRRSGEILTAASVGVSARTSAARSASVTSISCPTPATTGIGLAATARTSGSSLKAHRSSRLPPPRTTAITSTAGTRRAASVRALATSTAAPAPCTREGTTITSAAGQRPRSVSRKSWRAAPAGLVTTAIRRGKGGRGRFRCGAKSPSASRVAWSRRSFASRAPVPTACIRSIVSW